MKYSRYFYRSLNGFIIGILSFSIFNSHAAIRVLSPLNSIPASEKFEVSIATSRDGSYQRSHVHFTEEKGGAGEDWGYSAHIEGYEMSYVNFEFKDNAAWVKVKIPGKNIPDLVVRPTRKNVVVYYENDTDGRRIAKLKLQAPTSNYLKTQYLSVVPVVDGVHNTKEALGIFANPYTDVPSNNVVNVSAGNSVPKGTALVAGQTVVFKPGTHELGTNYGLKSGVNYYFTNGAYVKGTFLESGPYNNIRIYGYGILTSTHLKRYDANGKKYERRSLAITEANNILLQGLTFEDPAHHAVTIEGGQENKNKVENIKVISWRANGDGLHLSGVGEGRDSFFRTNDDSVYVASFMEDVDLERLVTWNDVNGSSFQFSYAGGGKNAHLKNSDVIYSRSRWSRDDPQADENNGWEDFHGGAVFNLTSLKQDKVIDNILIEDVRIEDEAMDRQVFSLQMGANPWDASVHPNNNTEFKNITFRNINAVYGGGYAQRIAGWNSQIFPKDINFECVKIGGKQVTSLDGWDLKNVVNSEISFKACDSDKDAGDTNGNNSGSGNGSWLNKYWRIENVSSGGWLRTQECSHNGKMPIVQVSSDYDGNCTMYRFEAVEEDYVRIINRSSGDYFIPQGCDTAGDENVPIVQVSPENSPGWCSQWKLNKDNNARYRLQNRSTGKYMRIAGCSNTMDDTAGLVQVGVSYDGDCTLWRLVNTGAYVGE